ncbi:membrane protein of unknown function [Methylacidimicrobium sp. AP8]|uniref:hypothetical protein n=1 Tax=Methylacidimicrobium sp. AP8 TaxID=2730359 RepID=UPI0018BF8CA8|nr:hypothetical protein [Methylacidimicrobium sp. AP8]CAB4243782.1 membrane protein of unknown function [Methylacidimicrobium sp. AP8]
MDAPNWVSEGVLKSARSLGEACWLAGLLGRFTFWEPIERSFSKRLPANAAPLTERALVAFLALGAIPVLASLIPAFGRSPAPATFGAFLGGLFGFGFLLSLPLRKPTVPWSALRWALWGLLGCTLLLDPAGKPAALPGPEAPLLWRALLRLLLLSLSLWLATLLAELLILTPVLARTGRRDPFILLLGTGSLVNSYAITVFGASGLGLAWLLALHPLSSSLGASGSLGKAIGALALFALLLRSFHQVLAEPAATAVLMRPRACRSPEAAPSACRLPLTTHALELFAVAGTLIAGNFLAAQSAASPPSAVAFRRIDLLFLPLLALLAAGGHRLFRFSRQLVDACLDLPPAEDPRRVPPVLVQLGWRQWLWAGGVFSLTALAILLVTGLPH